MKQSCCWWLGRRHWTMNGPGWDRLGGDWRRRQMRQVSESEGWVWFVLDAACRQQMLCCEVQLRCSSVDGVSVSAGSSCMLTCPGYLARRRACNESRHNRGQHGSCAVHVCHMRCLKGHTHDSRPAQHESLRQQCIDATSCNLHCRSQQQTAHVDTHAQKQAPGTHLRCEVDACGGSPLLPFAVLAVLALSGAS